MKRTQTPFTRSLTMSSVPAARALVGEHVEPGMNGAPCINKNGALNHQWPPLHQRLEKLRAVRIAYSEPTRSVDRHVAEDEEDDNDADEDDQSDASDSAPPPFRPAPGTEGAAAAEPPLASRSRASQFSSRTTSAFSLPGGASAANQQGSAGGGRGTNNSSAGSSESISISDQRRLLTYQRVLHDLANNDETHRQVAIGKRVGFYRLGKELGAGNFSKVKIGVHVLTNERVAVKIMDKTKMDQKAQRLLAREIANMEVVNHPNIIRLFEVVDTLNRVHLVVEYARGGELYQHVHERGKLKEEEAKILFAQITAAVGHLHDLHIAHRDIKAENIMFSEPNGLLKLVDFGFSRSTADGHLATFCGSPPYAAPELFRMVHSPASPLVPVEDAWDFTERYKSDTHYDGRAVDVWALGVLLYFMVVGVTPFRGETISDLKQRIMDGRFSLPEYLSIFVQELIRRMLDMDPQLRLSIDEVKKMYWLRDSRYAKASEHDDKDVEGVLVRLAEMGIDEPALDSAITKGSRSEIVGTYRLVTYQVRREQRELTARIKEARRKEEEAQLAGTSSGRRGMQISDKACTIL